MQIAASSISTLEGAVAVIIGVITFTVAVAASYVLIKARRSTVLADQQDKANNALQAELAASQATNLRVSAEVARLTSVMDEKQHQLDDKQRQIDDLKKDLTQKAAVDEVNSKVDLLLTHFQIVPA